MEYVSYMWKLVNPLESIDTCLFLVFVNLLCWACEYNDLSLPGPVDLGVRVLFVGVLFVSALVQNSLARVTS